MNEVVLKLIEHWIKYADAHNMSEHLKHFWNARDIIEDNNLNFSQEKIKETLDFIQNLNRTKEQCLIANEIISYLEV